MTHVILSITNAFYRCYVAAGLYTERDKDNEVFLVTFFS